MTGAVPSAPLDSALGSLWPEMLRDHFRDVQTEHGVGSVRPRPRLAVTPGNSADYGPPCDSASSTSTSSPRPWAPGDEHRLLTDALEQVELADRLGIDYLWLVEHHFLEEYSHSSAPEV